MRPRLITTKRILAAALVLTAAGAPVGAAGPGPQAGAVRVLDNGRLRAEFGPRGLLSLRDLGTGRALDWTAESFAVTIDGAAIDGASLVPSSVAAETDALTFVYQAGAYRLRVVYELKDGWGFLSKRIFVEPSRQAPFRVGEVRPFAAALGSAPAGELRLNEGRFGVCLRFPAGAAGGRAGGPSAWGAFLLLQNPYNVWTISGTSVSGSYVADMEWRPEYGPFATDHFCLGIHDLSGIRFPARAVPEWAFVPDYEAYLAANPAIDAAEAAALGECVRAFLLYRPERSIRVHVPWCENDYQIDVATPEGWAEYQRILTRAAELGCGYSLFTPANSELSSLAENRDSWGWENLLFFGLGQKIRKGEWVPGRDPVPPSLQAKIDFGRSLGLGYLAYAYPSLPFLQDPAWTKWAGDKVGGANAVDTGLRSFQDWWLGVLTDFVRKTGAAGFSFDHWWIAYDNPAATSRYAQWSGCRRILEELRRRLPGVVVDGRQQYMNFGPWTWLAGSYPHPTLTDEQPESFAAFPDLHTDRVSADRQRFAAWKYRMERFAPPEITPGYITHQTERSDTKGVMRRDRFRPRDWDVLGWRYSLLSSVGTAPFNHVVDFLPARDEEEFRALSAADKAWFHGWLDWTDANADVLRRLRPILGPPMIGRVDGTAACLDGRGFVFLFNPNYRSLEASFKLDASIGLDAGSAYLVRELHPDAGRLIGKPGTGIWTRGDAVTVRLRGAEAMVLEIGPAPGAVRAPLVFNVSGRAAIYGGRLDVAAEGETGTEREVLVLLPEGSDVAGVAVNGTELPFRREGNALTTKVRFAGEAFTRCQPVFPYDPAFAGGTIKGSFEVPARVFDQLRARREAWPVSYTEDDLLATWLGSHRLLLFVQIAEPDPSLAISLSIDGKSVELRKAYNSLYGHAPKRTFLGFYADVSGIEPDKPHAVELVLPKLAPGRFQGLFFENVEPELTAEIVPSPKS